MQANQCSPEAGVVVNFTSTIKWPTSKRYVGKKEMPLILELT